MFILLGFAFLAGIVTILSPCILPVLPLLLSGTIGSSKSRPYGIVTGFIVSFTVFTLFLASIVQLLHIPSTLLRDFAIAVIFLFGVSLLIPHLQEKIEIWVTRLGLQLPQGENRQGFLGGFLMGISLGLVWTPCVGPILASVISLALTGTVTGMAFFVVFAYALGTAIPMLGITIGGQRIMNVVPSLAKNTAKIQQVFGVVMIVVAIAMIAGLDQKFQTWILEKFPQYGAGLTIDNNDTVQKQLSNLKSNPLGGNQPGAVGSQAPALVAGGEWINSDPLTLDQLKGKVVMVDFWTYTCINCIRTLPYMKDLYTKYADKGLVIIGVHTPEFEFEKDANNVKKAVASDGIKYPVMQDNNYATWNAYQNQYWPAHYLIDKDGIIRFTHFGEGDYDQTEKQIQQLLQEAGADTSGIQVNEQTYDIKTQSPETYLGYGRTLGPASPERLQIDTMATYSFPKSLQLNQFAFAGEWKEEQEFATTGNNSQLEFNFSAQNVYLVMRPTDPKNTHLKVKVFLDDKQVDNTDAGVDVDPKTSEVTVDQDRLYHLIKLLQTGGHTLRLEFPPNVDAFVFTFG